MQDTSWDDLRFALAALRQRSFAGAAKTLSVDQTTVSRRIARLEERLGSILFERDAGTLSATRAILDLQHHAEAIEAAYGAARTSSGGTDTSVAGRVKVTDAPFLTNQILVPNLPKFLASHPQLELSLFAEAFDLSLLRREADIALRLAQTGRPDHRTEKRTGWLRYLCCARKANDNLPWITYIGAMDPLPQSHWVTKLAGRSDTSTSSVRINDAETLLSALRAGIGRSFLPCVVGDRDPSRIRLDPGPVDYSRELWMIVHPDNRNLARIRVTSDWLTSTLQRQSSRS